jgi:murein DD-endopeptidase MepM/ murein hydrolase activator NlpD
VTDPQTSMLVVLDADSDSLAPLSAAQKYASHTVVLRSWAADTPENAAHVESSASAEPTISEALKLAAERGIKWVGVRRSFLPPQEMLGELLSATARHATEATPGFAVLLTNGNHGPLQRILAIVNRSDGPVSGLAVYAAVAVADVAGAQLDILVIGSEDENPHTEDELDILVINRERELFDAAIARAEDRDVRVNWITAASVTDLWPVVADQLTQHDYDLVIDDLGNVSLAKVRRRASIQEALAAGSVGALPLKLLAETSVPVLLVIDEIRIRWAPPRALRAGAAAITLGVMTGPMAAAGAAPPATVATMPDEDPAVDLIRQLNLALSQAEQEAGAQDSAAVEEQRTADAGAASRGAGGEGARSGAAASVQATVPVMDFPATQYGAADYAAAVPAAGVAQPTGYVPDVEPTVVAEEATSKTSANSSDANTKKKKSSSAKKDSRTKAPKGGATPTQVAKAKNAAARDKAALEKAKKQKEKSAETVAELEEKIVEAAADAAEALAALEAASQSHAEATKAAEETAAAATGVASVLPSAPTELEVMSAALNEQVATQRLEAALSTGEESLETLESTDQALEAHQEKLADRRAAVQESRAGLEKSKDKAEAYQASLAKTRQSPVSKGRYNLTARYGSGGGYWSSGIHTGLDFAAPSGTPVMAAASGTVVSTGYEGAYGNRVVIRHGNGVMTTYNHLSSVSVSPGTKVSTGDQIGRVGTTGNTTGSHLHFEVTQNDRFVNPEAWLGW